MGKARETRTGVDGTAVLRRQGLQTPGSPRDQGSARDLRGTFAWVTSLIGVLGCVGLPSGCARDVPDGNGADVAPPSEPARGTPSNDASTPPEDEANDSPANYDCAKSGPFDAPPELGCTGYFAPGSRTSLGEGVREYEPAVTLYSDGADKKRWVFLPKGQKIDTKDPNAWVFPIGTKFWKEFSLQGKRIETRYYAKVDAGRWVGTTYRWNGKETVAKRLRSGERNVGGMAYNVPNEVHCDSCHAGSSDRTLGFEAVGLGLPESKGLTLETLANEGLLSDPPARTKFRLPEDTTGKAAPALGWLHANCGTACHNRGDQSEAAYLGLFLRLDAKALIAAGDVPFDARKTDTFLTNVDQVPRMPTFVGAPGTKRIVPGRSDLSELYALVSLPKDSPVNTMPPVGTLTHDTHGMAVLKAWIDAMKP